LLSRTSVVGSLCASLFPARPVADLRLFRVVRSEILFFPPV
jgi:hypothetical protein